MSTLPVGLPALLLRHVTAAHRPRLLGKLDLLVLFAGGNDLLVGLLGDVLDVGDAGDGAGVDGVQVGQRVDGPRVIRQVDGHELLLGENEETLGNDVVSPLAAAAGKDEFEVDDLGAEVEDAVLFLSLHHRHRELVAVQGGPIEFYSGS